MEKTFDIVEYFFKDNEARFTKGTIKVYRMSINQFFKFINKGYDNIKRIDIRQWYAYLDEKELKPRTVRNKLSALKSFYNYLMEENLVEKDPTKNIDFPKIEDSLPIYLDKRQLAQFMELTIDNQRDRVIIEMLYATGVRISELLDIKVSDIKWDTRQIWIRKGKGNKERFVLFTPECAERLKVYLEHNKIGSEYLFTNKSGKPFTTTYIELIFRKYSKELGFRITPHIMRHTFAAHLSEKGMPISYIQDLMGHENINTTRIYTRLSDKARKNQYDSLQ